MRSPNHSILFLALSASAELELPQKQPCPAIHPHSCCGYSQDLQRLLSTLAFPASSVMTLGRGKIFLGRINLLGMHLGTQVGEETRPTHKISPMHTFMCSAQTQSTCWLGCPSSDFRGSKQWVVAFSEAEMKGYFSQKGSSLDLYQFWGELFLDL